MNFVDKDGTTKVYIPVHPWITVKTMNCFIHFELSKTNANNTDFWTGKPVGTAPDWTGHVKSSANHCTRIPAQNPCNPCCL